ncbi:hypothetical protein I4U23_017294 [Adineta vaga]|nr:hypothetical protein I4U23_017294 [Adineta vaga]
MVSVETIQSGTVFAWFMLMMIIRRIVMLGVAMNAGRGKPFPPGSRPPEDSKLSGVKIQQSPTTTTSNQIEFTKDVRVNKTIHNDTENDPYFLILLIATALFSDGYSRNCSRTIAYGLLYLIIRTLYAVTYIIGLQPWRSIIYALGLALTLACSLDLVITMSLRPN